MTTGARGEGWLDEQNRCYPVLFTNRALLEVEKAIGKSITLVAGSGSMNMANDIIRALLVGLEYGRREAGERKLAYTMADAHNLLDEFGYKRALTVVTEALAECVTWEPEQSEGEPENPPE